MAGRRDPVARAEVFEVFIERVWECLGDEEAKLRIGGR